MNGHREEGFVLVGALWFVAILTLVAVIVEGWISTSLDRAVGLQSRVAAERALISASSRIAYVAVTGRFTVRGLEQTAPAAKADGENSLYTATSSGQPVAVLDGRGYRLGNVVVRLQDEAGLYDLSRPSRDTLGRLLRSSGVASRDAGVLFDALVEYVARRSGTRATAARNDYARAALPQPRHSPLLTPWEPLRVLGWQRLAAAWKDPVPIGDIVSTGPTSGLNPNTALPAVFAALTGLDERGAERFIAYRAAHLIVDAAGLAAIADVAVTEAVPFVFVPSDILRVKLSTEGDPLLHIARTRLTPRGQAPYRIDYAVAVPQNPATRGAERAGGLPAFPLHRLRD